MGQPSLGLANGVNRIVAARRPDSEEVVASDVKGCDDMNSERRWRWKYSLSAVPIMAAGLIAWLVWPVAESQSAETPTESLALEVAPTPIEALAVHSGDLSLRAEATGYLQAWREIGVIAEASGKVVWGGVEEGQWVDGGTPLFRLDDRERRIELAEAEAELLKVRANYAIFVNFREEENSAAETDDRRSMAAIDSRVAYQQAQELYNQGIIAERELLKARRRHETAETLTGDQQVEVQAAVTGLTQVEQQLERAHLALRRCQLTAPFAGRVADLKIAVGQQIAAGQECLVLLDESRLKVEVDVLEADVVWLRAGAPARVRVPALRDRVFQGRIHTINPRVATETGTGRVTVVIDNPDRALMPGLFAFVELETRRLSDRLLVPADAVLVRQGRDVVFRVENELAQWRYVTVGARTQEWVEIADGLSTGDQVAVAGHLALAHGSAVAVSVINESQVPGQWKD